MIQSAPQVALRHLDQLWFQVAGTRCNLTCHHCFISCSPHNRSFGFLSLEQVQRRLDESVPLGVKEYYFTGGEPFLNPDMTAILEATLNIGPATVLTNGTVFKPAWLKRLRRAADASIYSLEFRVSLDGFTAETNDAIRGSGTFDRALRGVGQLVQHGFLPIITAVRTWPMSRESDVIAGFVECLRRVGCDRPRLKILPTLHIGAEANRTHGYHVLERITPDMMRDYDESLLVCSHSRMVTDRGVHVCPILIESPDSLMGQQLKQAIGPFAVRHGACLTCYQYGSICSNPTNAEHLKTSAATAAPSAAVPTHSTHR